MSIKNLLTVVLLTLATGVTAQLKVGNNPTTINANSVLEIESTNKGLLLPRVALTGTASFAPLSAHVAGMAVYNTATAGNVTPGYYYNNGTNWQRLVDQSSVGSGNLTNSNGILVNNGTGATFLNTSLRLDSTAIAKMVGQSPVRDSIVSTINNQITNNAINGQNLTAGSLLLTTGTPTGASLKTAGYRVDTAALKTFVSNTIINNTGINGLNLTAGSLLQTTGTPTGASLKTAGYQVDTSALKTFVSNTIINNTGINGLNLTAGSLLQTTGTPTGASLKTAGYQVDTSALKTFVSNTIINNTGINGLNLTAGSLLQTTGTPTGASLKTAGYQVDTSALKTFVSNTIINNTGINGLNLTAGSLLQTTGTPTGASLKTAGYQVDTAALKTFVSNTITNNTGISGLNLTNQNGIIVTGGTGATLKSASLRLDSTAIAKFVTATGPVKDSIIKLINATDSSIYKNNGLLASNRSVFMGANTLAFDTSTLFINPTTNRVGIGTTSPLELLHVDKGNIKLGGNTSENKYPLLNIHTNYNADTTGGRITFTENSGTTGSFIQHNSNPGPIWGFDGLSFGAFNAAIPINPAKSAIFFSNLSTSRNFVGLGTSSPQQQLHFDGGSDNNINVAPTAAQTGNDVVFTSTGNVGIGTTNPSQKLHVENGSIYVGGDDVQITLGTFSQSRLGFVKKAGIPTVIASGSTENMRFGHWSTPDINGNVASGTFRKDLEIEAAGNVAVTNQIKISGGSPGAGKVLTSDAAGLASWTAQEAAAIDNSLFAKIYVGDVNANDGTFPLVFSNNQPFSCGLRTASGGRTTFLVNLPNLWPKDGRYNVQATYGARTNDGATAANWLNSLAPIGIYEITNSTFKICMLESVGGTIQDMEVNLTITRY